MGEPSVIETTIHGYNIANEIVGEDAYGAEGILTAADVWLILDQMRSNIIEAAPADVDLVKMLESWMAELDKKYEMEV